MITIDTPIGPFSMTGNGFAVTEAGFHCACEATLGQCRHEADAFPPDLEGNERAFKIAQSRHRRGSELPNAGVPPEAVKAIESYFDGDFDAIGSVPVRQSGTPYLEHCWDVLRTLREPVTYTEFAHLTGKPHAVRAAAQGCARNHIALFVPCHRVLRADGSLGGYRWGLHIKEWLLEHERKILS
jgi:methylated-DNA-[protein]-cysteine S-methyltransferase